MQIPQKKLGILQHTKKAIKILWIVACTAATSNVAFALEQQKSNINKVENKECLEVDAADIFKDPLPFDGKVVCGFARLYSKEDFAVLLGEEAKQDADIFNQVIILDDTPEALATRKKYKLANRVYFSGVIEVEKACWGYEFGDKGPVTVTCSPFKKPILLKKFEVQYLHVSIANKMMAEKEYGLAIKLYTKMANTGNSRSQMKLAEFYDRGNGVTASKYDAFKWYSVMANKGAPVAIDKLVSMLYEGVGTEKNIVQASKWALITIEAKLPHDAKYYNKVISSLSVQQLKDSHKLVAHWMRKHKINRNWRNTTTLDMKAFKGKKTETVLNEDQTSKFFASQLSKARSGDIRSQLTIGMLYVTGTGTEKNFNEAVKWYAQAADKGSIEALFKLGNIYMVGPAEVQDHKKGYDSFLRAAELNDVKSQGILANMFLKGKNIEKDSQRGFYWMSRAAELGDANSQHNLAILYLKGIGIERDYAQSYKWVIIAKNNGHPDKQKLEDVFKLKLPLEQKDVAKKMAEKWINDRLD